MAKIDLSFKLDLDRMAIILCNNKIKLSLINLTKLLINLHKLKISLNRLKTSLSRTNLLL